MKPGDHLYLVDGSTFIFRAYHALPPLTRKSDGLPVGAVSGFCNMLHKLLEDMKAGERPTHLAVIFDHSGRSFRNDLYPEYKANRSEPPEDLVPQFPLVREATRAFNVACIEQEGFEADDLIATYATLAKAAGGRVTIVSSDKDLMQLVDDGRVQMFDTMKDRRIGEAEVFEKFGVSPDKVVDVQSLAGDSVDNIPGIAGIGVKTAAELITTFGDLDTLLARAGEVKQPKRRQSLIEQADAARMSRELVRLRCDVPVETPLEETAVLEPEIGTLIGFLKAMEFTTLTRRIAAEHEVTDLDAFEPMARLAAGAGGPARPAPAGSAGDAPPAEEAGDGGSPGAVPDEAAVRAPIDTRAYETVTSLERLDALIATARERGLVAVDTETTSVHAMFADLVGISLAVGPGQAAYVPLAHGRDGLALSADTETQLPMEAVLARLRPLLADPAILKIGQNIKYDMIVLGRHGIEITPFDDTMLISYAMEAGAHGHGLDELSQLHLSHTTITFADVAGSGKAQVSFDKVPIAEATAYAAEDADVTFRLHALLKPRLAPARASAVYETLERPMAPVLRDMERAGIRIEPGLLRRLSQEFAHGMQALEAEAHAAAGGPFNLGSPKQLGEILYDRLGLGGGKRTKPGAYATGADVLEELAAEGHALPRILLDWRQIAKLKSTYTDALPTFIHPQTGRVHTCYSLASTSTGRLSSSDPNLQNIPIRTKEGRQIRTAFVADPGKRLVSADYSQIELRVLAHMADIPALKDAFARGLDIHAMTASEMFGVPIEGMDPMVRRRAKAINFGIIYGISAFGLANQLAIPRGEAQAYIDTYFERFPEIRAYMDRTKTFARKAGYVTTAFGRRVHTREIESKVPARRAFAERAAINAPIQGTAADIIRRAMIRMPDAMERAGLDARMLLQVHDELVFEVAEDQAEALAALAAEVMEGAALPVLPLSVPLKVDAKAGANWEEAH
ncbi:MAG: DNA polymerase I [Alphaproteobacteria bacterium]|nr:DNA polymerase I [Alphaproteobacteria bacterium]